LPESYDLLKDILKTKYLFTRRQLCAMLGVLGVGVLALPGCGSDSDPTSRTGFANDTEVKSYPVHLKIYADSYVQWHLSPYKEGPPTRLERQIERYQGAKDRSEVSFEVVYLSSAELFTMAQEGFPDGDGLLAFQGTVEAGCASGTVDAGIANLHVRELLRWFETVCLVRAAGSDAALPPAATLTGEDAPDGTFNRLQQLSNFDGLVALASPDATLEGLLANRALAREEFYSEFSGLDGSYSENIAAKIVVYPNQDAAMAAVVAGECQLGFALRTALTTRYPEVEEYYKPSGAQISYDGAALARSPEPGVMKDFFTLVQRSQ
jgi:hypothetical protein